jgi:aminoglycoside phosphotransferase (APT) family kinase protein
METEVRVLPRLAPHLPLAIPTPVWAGVPTERFPWPFAGYHKVSGRTGCSVDWTPEQRRAAAEPLAHFLSALHSTDAAGLGLPPDYIDRTDMAARRPNFIERVEELLSAGVIADGRPLLRLFERDDFPPPTSRPVPTHGDLYERHIVVDDDARPAGIIDWGDVHAGDPAVDLSLLYRFWPPDMRDGFLRVYGSVDERTATLARLRAAFHAVATTAFAHSTGDAALLNAGLTAMRHVVQD